MAILLLNVSTSVEPKVSLETQIVLALIRIQSQYKIIYFS